MLGEDQKESMQKYSCIGFNIFLQSHASADACTYMPTYTHTQRLKAFTNPLLKYIQENYYNKELTSFTITFFHS